MRTLHFIWLFLPLFLTACSSNDPDNSFTEGQGTVTFTFKVENEIKTRTILDGSENSQHVSSVHLYVFKGIADHAVCILTKDIVWPNASGSDVNYQTVARSYSLVLPEGEYTFLAIGLDDQSGATYDLPEYISNGTTLANATAILVAGKTKENIAISELFAGSTTATVSKNSSSALTINLFRRVAGIMGWFTNIPSEATEIQLSLYTQQNKSGYLKAQPEGNATPLGISNPENFKDYITSPVSSLKADKILVSVKVPTNIGAITTLSGGSYVLPSAAPVIGNGSEYTIQINIVSGGTVLKNIRTKLKPDDDLFIPSIGSDTGGPYRFPIVANYFYGIGSPDTPVDLGGDSEDIYIEINPNWSRIIDVPFE